MNDGKHKANNTLVEPLTERELEVLQLVTEGLSNREIAQQLVVALSTVKWHIKQIYGKLQVENRDEAMARATELGLVKTESEASPLPLHNLPLQPLPLIGREQELTELTALLNDSHIPLLTIIGSGGIGKTRLAIEVAAAHLDAFTNGVFWVSLAPISAPEFIISRIADAIGVTFYQGTDPQQQLFAYLREKQMLLVLDNFEHLLDGVGILSTIQTNAPAVKILVTSRERLNLYGETVYTLSGIAYPTPGQTIEEASNYGAIKLFEQSARRAKADFKLKSYNLEAAVRICTHLEGIPLAIEMAAAWVRMLSLDEIEMEIAHSLDFLATTRRDVSERHRTMRAIFDHSWQLLQPEEQRIFRALSTFRSGFQRQAAEHVADASLTSLSILTDKSLLQRESTGYYQIHELLRQYAAEKLSEVPDQEEEVQNRHCAYYAAFIQQRTEQMKDGNQPLVLDEIRGEMANIRLGWQHALTTRQYEKIEQYMAGLILFYDVCLKNWDALEIFDMAVTQLGNELQAGEAQQKRLYALALAAKCMFNVWFPTFQGTRARINEAFTILDQVGTRQDQAQPFFTLGLIHYVSSDYANAELYFQESMTRYTEFGNNWGKNLNLNMLGRVAYRLGEYEKARELLEEGLRICRQIGDQFGAAMILCSLSLVFQAIGHYERTEQLLQEALVIYGKLRSQWGIAYVMNDLGDVTFRQGNHAAARRILQESLTSFTVIGPQSYLMARVYRTLGRIAHDLHDYPVARSHFHDALQIAMATGTIQETLDTLVNIAELFNKEGDKEQALELLALVLQQSTTSYETKERAEGLIVELQTVFSPELFADLYEQGETLQLETVVASLITELEA